MSAPDLLFYDGGCGLCHHSVKFVLARDLEGTRFRFAPLQGPTFLAQYDEARRRDLPDSIIIHTHDGRTLVRSQAAMHIGTQLGGVWGTLARMGSFLPSWLLDWGYDRIAQVRSRIFARPKDACPMLPPELRGRFLP